MAKIMWEWQPSLILALWNKGILLHKQTTRAKKIGPEYTYDYPGLDLDQWHHCQ